MWFLKMCNKKCVNIYVCFLKIYSQCLHVQCFYMYIQYTYFINLLISHILMWGDRSVTTVIPYYFCLPYAHLACDVY